MSSLSKVFKYQLYFARDLLYTSDLFSLEVPVPPKVEQKEILDYIENVTAKIETAISCKQKEIEKLKEYKAVLINSAVTGKIKVSDN